MNEIIEIVHHGIEIVLAISIPVSTYYAIKKFKLRIWRKGWYFICFGGVLLIIYEIIEFIEIFQIKKIAEVIKHSCEILFLFFFVVGIMLLAKSANKIWKI